MNHQARKQWESDIRARQRNIVFPETVENEARFWRSLLERKTFTLTQIVGLLLIFSMSAGGIFAMVAWQLRDSGATGTFLARLVANFGGWIIAFFLVTVFVLVLGWRARREVANHDRHRRRTKS